MCKSILLALLVASCAFPQPLALDDCFRLALSAPSGVTAARIQTDIARYGLTQARANFLPQLSVGSAYTYNSPLPGVRDEFSFIQPGRGRFPDPACAGAHQLLHGESELT